LDEGPILWYVTAMVTAGSTLEVRSLTKWYGSTRGAEDVSFSVEPGEIFGYLGPNGAGKTTTLRCILGLLRPTRGEVLVLGKRVRPGWATQHARIGYLPGDFRIWPELKAGHTLAMLAGLGGADRETRIRRHGIADRIGLDLNRPVGDLSKGNRQKVGVVFAFQHRPDLLILDEPTAGLDPLVRQIVMDLIREAAAAGAAVLLSSHDLGEVSATCGRAAILREGRLVELAPISKIVQQGHRRLKVWLKEGEPSPGIVADPLPGVHATEQGSGVIEITYQGTADVVLRWLSQFPVDRIATPETSLEEAFIQYYTMPSKPAGGGVRP
jgi:ABC-2 type transport system ATP-binding protein